VKLTSVHLVLTLKVNKNLSLLPLYAIIVWCLLQGHIFDSSSHYVDRFCNVTVNLGIIYLQYASDHEMVITEKKHYCMQLQVRLQSDDTTFGGISHSINIHMPTVLDNQKINKYITCSTCSYL